MSAPRPVDDEDKPPLWMRLLGGPVPLIMFHRMDIMSDWHSARAGETWDCLMIQWFRRGWLLPWRRVKA